jgi:nucleoside-diphosphate-sugar epimerase
MEKAIVTGSTGFIGSVFVEHLLSKGVEVLALGRKQYFELTDYKKNKLSGATYLAVEMKNISTLPLHCSHIEWDAGEDCVFFNLAWSGVDRMSDLNVDAQMANVLYASNAFDAAQQMACKRFIHVGTMEEAFTNVYLGLDYREHTAYNRHVIYSVAKLSAKRMLYLRSRNVDMQFNYVLHSHVMGPEDDKDSFLQETLKKFLTGKDVVMSSGVQLFDVISVADCAYGYYLICKAGRPNEEYWVGSGDPRCLREYVERMHAMFPSSSSVKFGDLPYNDVILDREIFSIERLTRDTGYTPTMTFEETVTVLRNSFGAL